MCKDGCLTFFNFKTTIMKNFKNYTGRGGFCKLFMNLLTSKQKWLKEKRDNGGRIQKISNCAW